MNSSETDHHHSVTHRVLVNHEDQHSLWPAGKDIPSGWTTVFEGDREACLAYVEEHWVDMRPKSIREGFQ